MMFWDPNSLSVVIDWSAWATLSAVVGATWIGLRQAGISNRQAEMMGQQIEIARRQVEIEDSRLRAEMYDRRVAIYAAMETYLAGASVSEEPIPTELRDGLFRAIAVAPYLLDEEAEQIGVGIHQTATFLRGNQARLEHMRGLTAERRAVLIGKVEGYQNGLNELHSRLQGSKRKYLRLAPTVVVPKEI